MVCETAQNHMRTSSSAALAVDTEGDGLYRSNSAPGLALRGLSGTSKPSPGAQSKPSPATRSMTWTSPPVSPGAASVASRAPSRRGDVKYDAGLSRADDYRVKTQVQQDVRELHGEGPDFVPSLAAIDAIAKRPSFARLPARMTIAVASSPHDAPWSPWSPAGFAEAAAASAHVGATAFQSVAPRLLTGLPVYDGTDPRAMLADPRYGGFHTNYQYSASDWTPAFANGVLQSSSSRGGLPGAAEATPAELMAGSEPRRPARQRVHSSPMPKPGLAQVVESSAWRCSTAFQSRQPRLLGGMPTYLGHDLRQRMADDGYTGSHAHMYQPPTNADVAPPPPPKRASLVGQSQQQLTRPLYAPLDDEYRAVQRPNTSSSDDRFRYGVIVKYPKHSSANFKSAMPKVASEYPKPLEPYPRARPGVELNAQALSSYPTRNKSMT